MHPANKGRGVDLKAEMTTGTKLAGVIFGTWCPASGNPRGHVCATSVPRIMIGENLIGNAETRLIIPSDEILSRGHRRRAGERLMVI